MHYRACLAITGAIQGTSKEKIYDELGLHSLINRRWHGKLIFFYKIELIFFYKIVSGLQPDYLYSYLDFSSEENYPLRSVASSKLRVFSSRTMSFKNAFLGGAPTSICHFFCLSIHLSVCQSCTISQELHIIKS